MKEQMEELAKRLATHRAEHDTMMAEIRQAIIAAYERGYSITYIAKTLGVARITCYNVIKEQGVLMKPVKKDRS
jgi:transposase